MAVVPSVAICRACAYRERIELPGPGRVVANVGDNVTPADAVAFVVERGPLRTLNLAGSLRVEPRRVREFLAIKEGQSVRADEVVAQREAMMRVLQVRAPADGRVMAVGAGVALLEGFPSERPLRGSIPGRVVEVVAGESLTVEGTGAVIVASTMIGADFAGPLKMVAPVPERVLRPEHIDATCHGAIIVGGVGDDPAALRRASEFGAQGAMLGSAPSSWAGMALPLPVVLCEGYGSAPMNRLAFDVFNDLAGSLTYVIRRGARVWVIAPAPVEARTHFSGPALAPLEAGATVRVAGGPYAATTAEVVDYLPSTGEAILKGARERILVPAANVEVVVM